MNFVIDMSTQLTTVKERSEKILARWMEQEDSARLIVDDSLRIEWISDSANLRIARSKYLDQSEGVFRINDQTLQTKLVSLLRGLRRDQATFSIPKSNGYVIVRVREICRDANGRFFGIVVHDTSESDFQFADLDMAFSLTDREHEVLLQLAYGSYPEQIARTLSVSVSTVRTHLRAIYEKLNVSSKQELFGRLIPFIVQN